MDVLCVHRGQKWVLEPRTEVRMVVSLHVVLGPILRSSARAAASLPCRAVCPAHSGLSNSFYLT